jgi:hypothetical protein
LKSSVSVQGEYIVYLTKYGSGGSYELPNIININLLHERSKRLLRSVIHEIIHLAIEKYIDEYKVEQWKKERIVDLFFVRYFPRRVFVRDSYIAMDTQKVDQIFDDNFPNIEDIVKNAA